MLTKPKQTKIVPFPKKEKKPRSANIFKDGVDKYFRDIFIGLN